jgi:hypothetical protein
MNASTKTFFASLIVFACSLGFFIGAFAFSGSGFSFSACSKSGICEFQPGDCCSKQLDCCKRNEACCKKNAPCGPDCNCPQCRRHHGEEFGEGPHHNGKHFRDGKQFGKKFDFKKDLEFVDSVLQVSHEQKAALEKNRISMDSTIKELRKQKKDAEKALHEALDNNDDKKIAEAKANILKAQEGLLNNRINGVKSLNKILSKEQQEKFKFMQFERMRGKPGHGPQGHGPQGHDYH